MASTAVARHISARTLGSTGSLAISSTRRTPSGFRFLRPPSTRALRCPPAILVVVAVAACSSEPPQPTSLPLTSAPARSPAPSPTIPTTEDVAAVAFEIATADGRLDDVLNERPYVVEGVRPISGGVVDLFVRFDEPVPMTEWPDAVCSIEESSRPFTGIQWRVDLQAQTVQAVSPTWGQASCIVS